MRAVLAFLALCALSAHAQFTPDPARRSNDLPPDRSGPVPVRVDFFLLDVFEINGASETFRASLYVDLKWKDARLVFDAVAFGADRAIYPGAAAEEQLAAMWSPAIDLENLEGEPEVIDQLLTIHADGTVEFERRLTATFQSAMNLARFPFDQQTLEVRLESFVWNRDEVQLTPHEDPADRRPHVNDKLSVRGWSLLASSISVGAHRYVTGDEYSRFVSTMVVQRDPGFVMWSVVFPLVLVTFFALTCFFWDQETLSERIAQVLTCLLTVTAQGLVVQDDLPRISYFTPVDYAFFFTYLTLLLVAVISIWTKRVHESGRRELADRLDLRSAAVIAAVYTVGMMAVFWAR